MDYADFTDFFGWISNLLLLKNLSMENQIQPRCGCFRFKIFYPRISSGAIQI